MAITLNNNYQEIAWGYVGSTGSLNVYIRLYAKVNSQSVANNNSSVSYQSRLYAEGSGSYFETYSTTTKSISGTGASGSSQDASGTYYKGETTLQTITGTVTHNSDGSKTVTGSANFTSTPWGWNGTTNLKDTINLPKINRTAVTNSVTGSDIEQEFSVNYTKYVSSYTYKLRISIPSVKELEKIDYPTSGTAFTLSKASIEDIYDRYPDTNTFNLGFAVETWNGSTKLSQGNEKIISCTKTDRIGRLRINGEWKRSTPYVRINGEWVKAIPYTRINNEWKRGR